jgi:hypothetical protein
MFNEVIRIADGKPLELELQMVVSTGILEIEHPGQDELLHAHYGEGSIAFGLSENLHSLLEPYFLGSWAWSIPRGQVRSRCRR